MDAPIICGFKFICAPYDVTSSIWFVVGLYHDDTIQSDKTS